MPDPTWRTEPESKRRAISALAESGQSVSFASCPTCAGPNRTPIQHANCEPVDVFAGKGLTDGEVGAGVSMGKVNAPPSSSSSASHPSANIKAAGFSYPFATYRKFNGVKPESGKVQPAKDRTVRGSRPGSYPPPSCHPPFSSRTLEWLSGNLDPATRTVQPQRHSQSLEKKPRTSRNSEAAVADSRNHGPASPTTNTNGVQSNTSLNITLSETWAYNDVQWQDREEKIFQDLSGSSGGLGPCLQILAESWGGEPVAIAATPGFCCDFLAHGIGPCTDEQLINDPDRVGLQGLNVLLRFGEDQI